MIDQQSERRSDRLEWPPKFKAVKPGQAARELEKRLLIHSEEIHTESGVHAKRMETWECWARRIRFQHRVVEVADAKRRLEKKVHVLNERFGASAELPWIDHPKQPAARGPRPKSGEHSKSLSVAAFVAAANRVGNLARCYHC